MSSDDDSPARAQALPNHKAQHSRDPALCGVQNVNKTIEPRWSDEDLSTNAGKTISVNPMPVSTVEEQKAAMAAAVATAREIVTHPPPDGMLAPG